jgi:hypothetical protein
MANLATIFLNIGSLFKNNLELRSVLQPLASHHVSEAGFSQLLQTGLLSASTHAPSSLVYT